MSIERELQKRSVNKCELCSNEYDLKMYIVPPKNGSKVDDCIMSCTNCFEQLNDSDKIVANHWRCLNDSMWSEVPAVQVVAWRMLHHLKSEDWPADLLEMMYLDDETMEWAKEGIEEDGDEAIVHKDSNGNILEAGDTVTLIKDLIVKGANFTAKRGVAVRRISLVADNPEHIEGKVEGQRIVILTQFVKKVK